MGAVAITRIIVLGGGVVTREVSSKADSIQAEGFSFSFLTSFLFSVVTRLE